MARLASVNRPRHPTFPELLKVMRQRAGFASQHALDEACGFALSTTAQYENGLREPGLNNLARLCDALGCSADSLLGRKPLPKRRPAP